MESMTTELQNESVMVQPRILIADDQPDLLEALRLLLKGHGYVTESVTSPAALLGAIAQKHFDLILMDLNYARDTTSGAEGLDLLSQLHALEDTPPIVVMTGWATVGLAVQAMQRGVGDFVEKPWVNARLLEILKTQIEKGRASRESQKNSVETARAQNQIATQLQQRENEIEEARGIQQGFLPREIPQLEGFTISTAWQPARVVGGDYYDIVRLEPQALGICIADVAGKGMPAALLMSNLQAAFRGLAATAPEPDVLCERLNSLVCQNISTGRFITLFYAQLDGNTRTLKYVNAGHNAPIVVRQDGSHARLAEGGGVLGIFVDQKFTSGTHTLEPGDRIVLFTDGISEAANADLEEFGEKRLVDLMLEDAGLQPAELQEKILRAADGFCNGTWQDDATLIVVAVE
jgi:sigma-B regulation protein RsbU (phosphoserine phosphatase)